MNITAPTATTGWLAIGQTAASARRSATGDRADETMGCAGQGPHHAMPAQRRVARASKAVRTTAGMPSWLRVSRMADAGSRRLPVPRHRDRRAPRSKPPCHRLRAEGGSAGQRVDRQSGCALGTIHGAVCSTVWGNCPVTLSPLAPAVCSASHIDHDLRCPINSAPVAVDRVRVIVQDKRCSSGTPMPDNRLRQRLPGSVRSSVGRASRPVAGRRTASPGGGGSRMGEKALPEGH